MVTGRSDGGSDAGRTAALGGGSGTFRASGLGREVGGSGTVRAADFRIIVVGGTELLRSAGGDGGGSTGAARATGLGMMNAGFALLGTSPALR
jgi:hypothetical protein